MFINTNCFYWCPAPVAGNGGAVMCVFAGI